MLAASFYGYAPMQIPSGLIAHRFGSPRWQIGACMLLICGLNTAVPTVLRAAGHSGGSAALMALMIPLGVAQALLNPSLHKLISNWAPTNERTRMHNTIYA